VDAAGELGTAEEVDVLEPLPQPLNRATATSEATGRQCRACVKTPPFDFSHPFIHHGT